MITREQLRQLAEVESPEGAAISFYFQPGTPQDKSHRGEAILIKDLVRGALREAERTGNGNSARADLRKILELSERLHGNHARAKAVFACEQRGVWQEFDLPARLRQSELFINNRFHLRPLAALLSGPPRSLVVLIDREKARIFEVSMDEVKERIGFFESLPRRGRSDGWAGYDAGHAERHVDNEAMRHFKFVADRLFHESKRGSFEALLVGCRDATWPDFEAQLHPYVRQRLVGRFEADVVATGEQQLHHHAERLLSEHLAGERQGLIREVVGEARRNGRGSLGLRNVLRSLERGEVQALLLGEDFSAEVVRCRNCGHVDTRMVKDCAVCAQETREVDAADVLVEHAFHGGVRLLYVGDDPEFRRAGNIGALLRFRADQNTAAKLAV